MTRNIISQPIATMQSFVVMRREYTMKIVENSLNVIKLYLN